MGLDILSIKPHQVSRDMRGYSVLFYGDPKTGKTTISSQFPRSLLLAFEKGYSALPGVMAQPINSWGEFKKVLRQLKKEEAKALYETVVIDTIDIAYDYCVKYVCANHGVDAIGDIPYGGGYKLVETEFDEALREVVKIDYGLVLISHSVDSTFKDANGVEFNQIVPTVDKRGRKVASRLCDIIGYSRAVKNEETGELVTKLFMRGTPRYMAGSRFKYTPDYIDFTYDNLVQAIADAIEKQAQETKSEYFTDNKNNVYKTIDTKELDYDELRAEFDEVVKKQVQKYGLEEFEQKYANKITDIVEKYLGTGKKVNDCSRSQVEALDLVVTAVKELFQ